MQKIDLGQTIGILANLGVLADIVFLGIELQQNNEAMAVQARLAREDAFRQSEAMRLQNSDLIRATVKARDNQPLTAEERLLINEMNRNVLVGMLLIWNQARDDLIGEQELSIPGWRYAFHQRYPLIRESWTEWKNQVGESAFSAWMEENVISPGLP